MAVGGYGPIEERQDVWQRHLEEFVDEVRGALGVDRLGVSAGVPDLRQGRQSVPGSRQPATIDPAEFLVDGELTREVSMIITNKCLP